MDPTSEEARQSDPGAFERLSEAHRRELLVHCYRMLGSVEDAEDAVQETFLRAWRRLDTFAGRAPFRAWLYGIATNACLDALRRKKARMWPTDFAEAAMPRGYVPADSDLPWLSPYPDRLLDTPGPAEEEPEAVVTSKETIELAFLAAIQRLPARQRAVLILRDVVDSPAKETAEALGMTPAAVNSALQRARASLSEHLPSGRGQWPSRPQTGERAVLQRLIEAWERSDTAALVELLRADVRLVMPPSASWLAGRDSLEVFFHDHVFGLMGQHWRLVPTAANRQPAFAVYYAGEGGPVHRNFGIGVLDVVDGEVAEMALFQRPDLFATFALPAELP